MSAPLMHHSLWYLMRLSLRGRLRRMGQMFKTVKGAIFLLIMLGFLGLMIAGSFIGSGSGFGQNPESIRTYGGAVLLAYWLFNALLGKTEGGIPFMPAEAEFLFPAPLPRRHLLLYRIISMSLVALPSSFFVMLVVARNAPSVIASCVGLWLTMMFVTLSQMVWGLVTGILEQQFVARGRKLLWVAMAVMIVACFVTGNVTLNLSLQSLKDLLQSPVAKVVLAPFNVFSSAIMAERLWPDAIVQGAIAVGINFGLVMLILRLDRNFTEASLGASQRVAERIAAMSKGQMTSGRSNKMLRGLHAPKLPRLGGAGPIAWSQLTSLFRSAGSMSALLIIMAGAMLVPAIVTRNSEAVAGVLPVMISMSVFMFPQFIVYDFRSDPDRIPVLKSLPLKPRAVCLGQLITPVLVLSVTQLVLILIGVIAGPVMDSWILPTLLIFMLPAAFLLLAVENFVFLLFPFRFTATSGQSPQMMMRYMLSMLLKMLLLALAAGLAGGAGGLTYWLSGSQLVPAFVVAWVVSCAVCYASLSALAWAFIRFDPASDVAA